MPPGLARGVLLCHQTTGHSEKEIRPLCVQRQYHSVSSISMPFYSEKQFSLDEASASFDSQCSLVLMSTAFLYHYQYLATPATPKRTIPSEHGATPGVQRAAPLPGVQRRSALAHGTLLDSAGRQKVPRPVAPCLNVSPIPPAREHDPPAGSDGLNRPRRSPGREATVASLRPPVVPLLWGFQRGRSPLAH